ncbi:helix-turn-helix domain-containing protein [Sideroxydans sp.]
MAKRKAADLGKSSEEQDLRSILAQNVRRIRREQSLSQEDLAFRSDLDRTYISAVERCIWNVSLGNIGKIAAALNVEPWQLLIPEKE